VSRVMSRIGLAALFIIALGMTGAPRRPYSPREKAFYAPEAVVNFVRPGLAVKINSAQIADDGTITVIYSITDPKGLPLDIAGVSTPGSVSVSYVAAALPNNQTQYVAYTTRSATGKVSGSVNQAAADSGGTRTEVATGI
jgi:hypothetical protein